MTRPVQGAILVLFGVALLRLASGEVLLRFVRASARPWIVLGAAGVVLLGIATLAVDTRGSASGGRHGHLPRVTWFAIAPVVAILVVGPPALGSYTAGHRGPAVVHPDADPLPPLRRRAVVPMQLTEFAIRAISKGGASLHGHVVALTGFVAHGEPSGFALARLIITCCAADAAPLFVHVQGPSTTTGEWVRVEGRYAGLGADHEPALVAVRIVAVPAPSRPYE